MGLWEKEPSVQYGLDRLSAFGPPQGNLMHAMQAGHSMPICPIFVWDENNR